MKRIFYITLLALFVYAPSSALASNCGRPASKDLVPQAVDSLYILQSAVGARECRLEDCDINSDCRISVSDALGTLRSAVGDDDVELGCRSECPTTVPCGSENAPMCNGTCPADQACMPVVGDGEDHDDRVTICHLPPGNPGNARTLVVGESSVPAHLSHGDELGPCEDLGMGLSSVTRDRGEDDHGDSDGHDEADLGDEHGDSDGAAPEPGQADCVCVPIDITTTTTMAPATTTTTTMGPSIAAGQAIYDTRCQFCHSAGTHDTTGGPGGSLTRKGSRLRNNLGSISGQMTGLTLTNQELGDLAAFLNSL